MQKGRNLHFLTSSTNFFHKLMAGQITNLILKEHYEGLNVKLKTIRLDPYIRQLEAKKGKNKGLIFPFARGLRFSALLIYQIRRYLDGSNLTANWGQLMNDATDEYSNECDIIIHEKGAELDKWNGNEGNIMDFRFIDNNKVKVVISCKSFLNPSTIEIDYLTNMKRFVDKIWLFAECCGNRSVDDISKKSTAIGYEYFFYLYKWNRKTGEVKDDFDSWKDFVSKINALKTVA
jgi:hypothetical protein